jgi:hypothetical protein
MLNIDFEASSLGGKFESSCRDFTNEILKMIEAYHGQVKSNSFFVFFDQLSKRANYQDFENLINEQKDHLTLTYEIDLVVEWFGKKYAMRGELNMLPFKDKTKTVGLFSSSNPTESVECINVSRGEDSVRWIESIFCNPHNYELEY